MGLVLLSNISISKSYKEIYLCIDIYSKLTSYRSARSLLVSLLGMEIEESGHGPSIEDSVWLSCESLLKALNFILSFVVVRVKMGASTFFFPSNILTIEDMDGLSVGIGLEHSRAMFNIFIASRLE